VYYSIMLFCFFFVACKAAKAASSRILLEYNVSAKWNDQRILYIHIKWSKTLAECNELGKFHSELEAVALSFRPVWLQMANMMLATGGNLAFGIQ
jgi:hypothetical protein